MSDINFRFERFRHRVLFLAHSPFEQRRCRPFGSRNQRNAVDPRLSATRREAGMSRWSSLILLVAFLIVGLVAYWWINFTPNSPPPTIAPTEQPEDKSAENRTTLAPKLAKEIIYLAEQLNKYPLMKAYVLGHEMVEGDDEMIVIMNSASDAIYDSINSPDTLGQLAKHTGDKIFEIEFHPAPGHLLELTDAGASVFDEALKNAGIEEGYSADTLYVLTKNIALSGRDDIITAAAQLKR